MLTTHRKGLDAVAHALLEKETIDGQEVGSLVDEAYGRPVHPGNGHVSGEVGTLFKPKSKPGVSGDGVVGDGAPEAAVVGDGAPGGSGSDGSEVPGVASGS